MKMEYKMYKSLVYCNVIKYMKYLESCSVAGGLKMYMKAVPSCRTSNTESPLTKLQ